MFALCKFRWLVAGLSPRRPGFDPVPVYMKYVLYKVAVGQVALEVFQCSFVITNSQMPPIHVLFIHYCLCLPVTVAARSKALVYGRFSAEILGSNPTGGMDVCLL